MSGSASLTLRQVLPSDEPFLFELFKEGRAAEFAPLGLPPEALEGLLGQQFRAQQAHYQATYPQATFELILQGQTPVGRLTLAQDEAIHLIDIAILPAFQGQGIGGRILGDLSERADQAGKPIRLTVRHGNRAINLYRRLGFAVAGDDGLDLRMERLPFDKSASSV